MNIGTQAAMDREQAEDRTHANDDGPVWQFYLTPPDAWDAMYDDCAAATQTIEMEQYILHNDAVGQKFMRLFIDKARQGILIRLLCDEVGSGSMAHSPLIAELRQAGGFFQFYNSLKWIDLFKPRRIFPRTHLKVLTVDSAVAYIGGVCLAERMRGWRDTHLRLTGPIVAQMRKALDRNSHELIGHEYERVRQSPPAQQDEDKNFSYIQNDPAFFRHPIYQILLEQIGQAKEFIYISAAFFIPTRRLRRYLKQAAERGCEVIVLVPHRSDSRLADWACRSYGAELLRSGVRMYHYMPSVLHTKTTLIDGLWATVGSCNMDPLSFFHNREANIITHHRDVMQEMRQDFLNDLKRSRELTLAQFKNEALWLRAACHVSRLFRFFL